MDGMGKITANQKLQLIRSIREESLDNRMKMRHRERLLYGTESKTGDEMPLYSKGYYGGGEKELYALEEGGIPVTGNSLSSFKIRLVLAAALFCVYLVADAGEGRIGGTSTEEMREEMNKDFDAGLEEVVFDFEDSFPYTLFK